MSEGNKKSERGTNRERERERKRRKREGESFLERKHCKALILE